MRVLFATVAATALFLAGFGSQAAAASAQALRPVGPVTGAALRQLVTGHTFRTTNQYNDPFALTLWTDGSATGTGVNRAGYHGTADGSWKFKGNNEFCNKLTWAMKYKMPWICRSIYWNGKNFVESKYHHIATFTKPASDYRYPPLQAINPPLH